MTPETVTGEQLYAEIRAHAAASGRSLREYTRPLFGEADSKWKLEQLRIARNPTRSTIERVRALLAGEPLPDRPASPRRGLPLRTDRRNPDGDHRMSGDEIARRRALTDVARVFRRPGEPLADAIKRLREGE